MSGVVVAGGGLAGAAVACQLAQAGRRVTVFERATGPGHKICGEFLSIEAQHYLTRLGLDLPALGGHVIDEVRLVRDARVISSKLPFRGLGLTRHALDEALLRHAERCGATLRRGETVTSPDGMTFLATGKHDLRGERRLTAEPEDLVGFKMYFQLTRPQQSELGHAVEVMLFADGYAGLQMVEGGRANLCLLVHRDRLARSGGQWDGLIADLRGGAAHLDHRLTGARALLERPLTIARVPYGFIHTARPDDAFYRLGDQACVIPSFSGDGMALTLHSAALAAQYYLAGQSPCAYHTALARDVAGPIGRAMLLYRLGRADPGQSWLLRAAQLWPGLLRQAAIHTRVPTRALLRHAA
jgi:flavin-dependent dehydrogenase